MARLYPIGDHEPCAAVACQKCICFRAAIKALALGIELQIPVKALGNISQVSQPRGGADRFYPTVLNRSSTLADRVDEIGEVVYAHVTLGARLSLLAQQNLEFVKALDRHSAIRSIKRIAHEDPFLRVLIRTHMRRPDPEIIVQSGRHWRIRLLPDSRPVAINQPLRQFDFSDDAFAEQTNRMLQRLRTSQLHAMVHDPAVMDFKRARTADEYVLIGIAEKGNLHIGNFHESDDVVSSASVDSERGDAYPIRRRPT